MKEIITITNKENPQRKEKEERAEPVKKTMLELSKELNESLERFPFPGINPETYTRLKQFDQDYPGLATPIDELIDRFKNEKRELFQEKIPIAATFLHYRQTVLTLSAAAFPLKTWQ